MAYKSCAAQIAANIQQDCERPLVGGYTGRVVIIRANDFARAEVVVSADNPREIMSIVFAPDADVKTYYIDNAFTTPLSGSSTAGNSDSGRNAYQKTLAIRVPMRGADVSRDVIEPLVKSADGFVAIAEKRDKVGDGSYEVIGYQNSLRGDIASVTRDESANGGDWLVNLVTVETWAEVDLVGSAGTYESAKKEFENLLGYERETIAFVTENEDERIILTANGLVYIDSVKSGETKRQTLSSPNSLTVTVENDANSEVVIYGEIIEFRAMYYTGAKLSTLNVGKAISLKSLHIEHNTSLTSLDVSNNIALTGLYCDGCTGLTSLDVSKNVELTYFDCSDCTGLTSLDVSKNIALTDLYCRGCAGLTSLDASKNVAVTRLFCSGCTGLTRLDIPKNGELTYLDCNGCTGLTSLDVSKNVELTYFECYDCTGLTSLDVSKNIALTDLYCNGCTGLTSIDLSKNIELSILTCYDCSGLTSLDLSKNVVLTSLSCHGCTGLMLLDIVNTSALEDGTILDQSMANLTTLQVAGTSAWAYGQVESWLSDYAPNDGKLYVDENTPQGVITEAETKNWEVIYQS